MPCFVPWLRANGHERRMKATAMRAIRRRTGLAFTTSFTSQYQKESAVNQRKSDLKLQVWPTLGKTESRLLSSLAKSSKIDGRDLAHGAIDHEETVLRTADL